MTHRHDANRRIFAISKQMHQTERTKSFGKLSQTKTVMSHEEMELIPMVSAYHNEGCFVGRLNICVTKQKALTLLKSSGIYIC